MIDHKIEARKYSDLKEKLAQINPRGMAEYLEEKSSFIEEILSSALEAVLDRHFRSAPFAAQGKGG